MPDIHARDILDISGLLIAADVPTQHVESAMAGKIEPVRVVLHDKTRNVTFEIPCRPITEQEAVMLINRYLSEGKIEFGFRKKERTYGGPVL